MSEPIFPVIETDATELYRIGMERIADLVPDFDTDVVASPESWLLEAVAEIAAEVQARASMVSESIFRHYGEKILNIQPSEGQPAVATLTVLAGDTLGHTIPEGTTFQLFIDGEVSFEFEAPDDVIIPNGSNTATFDVVCTSTTAEANGAGVAGAELVDAIPYVTLVTASTVAADGADEETEDEYLERLTDTLRLLSTRPITARDFEISARANFGGRWLALDTYNPNTATYNNPLTITLVGVKENGTSFTADERAAVDAFMQANRMTNFEVFVIPPVYQSVNVAFGITVDDGFTPADVLADAQANVVNYLSPEYWGLPNTGDEYRWVENTKVRYFDMVAVLVGTVGVKSLESLTLNGGTSDVTLTNRWTLVQSGTIAGAIV